MHMFDPLCDYPSDLLGVNPTTNNRMVLYCHLMDKMDWFRRYSTVFSWEGCHSWH
jgi:hypothetical protein